MSVQAKALFYYVDYQRFFAKCLNESSSEFATLRSVSKEVKVFVFMSPFITLIIRESGRALYLCLCAFVFVIVLLSLSLCYLLLRWVSESQEEHCVFVFVILSFYLYFCLCVFVFVSPCITLSIRESGRALAGAHV